MYWNTDLKWPPVVFEFSIMYIKHDFHAKHFFKLPATHI